MSSFSLNNVYLKSRYTVASKKEKEGPLKNYIDYFYKDNYCNEISFEKAEQRLNKTAINGVIKNISLNDIGLFIGSDLLNQISSSNYIMRDYDIPFIGTYSACAASGLNIILASFIATVAETGLTEEWQLLNIHDTYHGVLAPEELDSIMQYFG